MASTTLFNKNLKIYIAVSIGHTIAMAKILIVLS
jgi:hypothetical protein